ncbi:MAG: hypothetical protein ACSHXL_05610 [Bacteroidota bacterium]
MKNLILITALLLSTFSFGQKNQKLNLTNALIVGQMDKEDERFMLEIALTEFFAERKVNAVPSINVLKQGADPSKLVTPELRQTVKDLGIDTYMLVSVRGYDSRFRKTNKNDSLAVALDYGTLFSLYRAELTSITFEFFIYRNDVMVKTALVRCGNISSKEVVLKRLKKKLARKYKKW